LEHVEHLERELRVQDLEHLEREHIGTFGK